MPRAVVVSEVRLYREGLAWSLRQRLDVVATPGSADTALDVIISQRPELAFVDAALPDGVALVRALGQVAQLTRAIAVSIAEVESTVLEWAEAGVVGYASRDASINDLLAIVESVERGECPCSPRIAGSLLRRVAALAGGNRSAPPAASLTQREKEIVALITRGLQQADRRVARHRGRHRKESRPQHPGEAACHAPGRGDELRSVTASPGSGSLPEPRMNLPSESPHVLPDEI